MEKQNFGVLGIVGIVAVVGLVIMFLNSGTTTTTQPAAAVEEPELTLEEIEEEGDLAGEAIWFHRENSKWKIYGTEWGKYQYYKPNPQIRFNVNNNVSVDLTVKKWYFGKWRGISSCKGKGTGGILCSYRGVDFVRVNGTYGNGTYANLTYPRTAFGR